MRLILSSDDGEVLDFAVITPEEFKDEVASNPHGVLSNLSPGAEALK